MLDLLSFIFQVLTNKLSDLIFFIEDFFFLGDVATKRIRLTKLLDKKGTTFVHYMNPGRSKYDAISSNNVISFKNYTFVVLA
jgi:hypothetical protein